MFFKKKPLSTYYCGIAGLYYYTANVNSIATERPKYKLPDNELLKKVSGKRAYKYGYPSEPVQLVPEPTNPHDKNAIQIFLAGVLVGYVPSNQTKEVKTILKKAKIDKMEVYVSGGEHKLVENGLITYVNDPLQGELRIYYR